ncbi:MAG: Lon protease-like protein [Candidatus Aldehydirespiratoraceae bacterium]|jgi:Lon protease-like protein
MFPLEQTILPTAIVPLHIFEARYRQFAADITPRPEPEFGIAPIERGGEVGGDDQRANVGIVARVIQHEEFSDGRWGIVALATRRIRVHEWLTDDPYPRAMVDDWPDQDAAEPRPDAVAEVARLAGVLDRVRRAVERLAPQQELPDWALPDDPAQAIWTSAVAAQLGAYDAAQLLRSEGTGDRLPLAVEMIEERAAVLEALADERG